MNKQELTDIKNNIINLASKLEVIADNFQNEISRVDQTNPSTFETSQETKLREQESNLRIAVKKLSEAEEYIFDVLFP